ncbi:MAG: transcription-repair coupling factor [Pseudomonadota bacterium]
MYLTGVHGAEKAYLAARLLPEAGKTILAVFPDQKDALRFLEDLDFFLPNRHGATLYFPGYNILPFKSLSYHSETATRRISALYRMVTQSRNRIIVTYVDTLLQKMIPRKTLVEAADLVINREDLDRDLLIAKLNSGGYVRTSLVEEPGDYSVRGGILDLFSPGSPYPVRIEQFGDYVESLRYFSPITQRGIKEIEEAVIIPATEAVVPKAELTQLVHRLRTAGANAGISGVKMRDHVDRAKEFGRFPGMESMLSIVYPELDTLLDYVPGDALVLLDRPWDIHARAMEFEVKARENHALAREEKRLSVPPGSIYQFWDDLKPVLEKRQTIVLSHPVVDPSIDSDRNREVNPGFEDNSLLCASLARHGAHENILKPLAEWFITRRDEGMAAIAVCTSRTQTQRLISLLQPYGIQPSPLEGRPGFDRIPPGIYYREGSLSSGFVLAGEYMALVTEKEIFGARKQRQKSSGRKVKSQFITPEEMQTGDIVVHVEHGLGRYDGLVTITVDNVTQDFFQISYRDDDRLYLPVDRMEMIEKYVGVDDFVPILDKIGGRTWQKSKAKAKKEVEKMAGDLLKLYAERKVVSGYAFSPPDTFFNDFEASFPYDETPDQLQAIDDVLADMEKDTPMDRLVCGDVGYGKTEVALRAAFKAVNDARQVAVVVPTTILAEQHLLTFRQRFEPYPVNIEALSRFRTRKEQQDIIRRLAAGKVDIVIGTHRLLQKDVQFKSLGLLVIDEEQRFGVKHKEALKTRRSIIDVLALTATPIPRTLHMSLTGMRDISVISTPPADRQPIISYMSEYDDAIAAEAIRRELSRQGQIFFVHNTIENIGKIAEKLQKLVPEVKLGIAHGRLTESQLETVMMKFIKREIDMLVCTTIVESGLDIPSANTMIINRADRFGLSQIYQLRGRIGRGDEQAYAYLFIPDESRLSRDAKKRLAALMEHRDLGSGFQIAMKDLQIRGAGSALGASQSGHIAAVGYDMFLQLLDEAVADLQGKPVVAPLEPEINIPLSTFISEEYVQSIEQRLTLYRRLSQMTEVSEISAMQKELSDRFGTIPEETGNMLLKIMLRVLAIKAGVKRLDLNANTLTLVFSELHQKRPVAHIASLSASIVTIEYTAENTLRMVLGTGRKTLSKAMGQAKQILTSIAASVND